MPRFLMPSPFAGANRVRSSSTAIDHFEIHQGTHILQVSLLSRLIATGDGIARQIRGRFLLCSSGRLFSINDQNEVRVERALSGRHFTFERIDSFGSFRLNGQERILRFLREYSMHTYCSSISYFLSLQSLDGFAMAVAADGRFLYISETVSIYLGLSQVSSARRSEISMKPGG